MAKHKRGLARTQTALLPPSVEDYVGAHALVRVIDLYVDGLDMVALGFKKSVALDEGRPPYAPDDLLKLYLYGYWNRIRTSRKLEAECKRNLELIWLLGTLSFDHKTIADFRRENAKPFKAVCSQFVQFLREAQLVGGEAPVVAVDGSKFKACASKASLVSAEQVVKRRAQDRRLMRLRSATVEHPFGNLKAMMPGGFLLRTLPKVQGEMALAVLTYNLKRALNILGFENLMRQLKMIPALGSA